MREFDRILRGLDREALAALAEGLLERMGGSPRADAMRRSAVEYGAETDMRRDELIPPYGWGVVAEAERQAHSRYETKEWADTSVRPYGDGEAGRPGVRPLREVFEAARRDVEDAVPYGWAGEEAPHSSPSAIPSPQGEGFKSPEETFVIPHTDERERMRAVSDFFRRDGRRYDGGFTRY